MGLFSKKEKPITKEFELGKDTSYTLTSVGKEKAESISVKGDLLFILQTVLERGSTATTREIAEETHFDTRKVTNLVKRLKTSGYLKEVKIDG